MIGRPPGRFRHDPDKAHGAEIEFVNEDFDDPDRIVLRYVIVQALGKQCRLPAILALGRSKSTALPISGSFTRTAPAVLRMRGRSIAEMGQWRMMEHRQGNPLGRRLPLVDNC